MDPAAKLLIGAIGSVVAGLLFVACFATPDDRAEATRAAIRNAPVACAIYLTDDRIPKEPALDEICRAVAGVGEVVRAEEVPPLETDSGIPEGDAGISTTPGNAVRAVDGGT